MQSVSAYGYVIRGSIVDEAGKPIHKAVVIGRNDDDDIVIGIETDQAGQFYSADIEDTSLLVEISKEGRNTLFINVVGTADEFVDLGTIKLLPRAVELDEVSVTAQSVTQKADRYIVIPSKSEISQSTNGLSLLNNLQFKMPGLVVNEALQTVKVDNSTPVFKINGKPTDLNRFLSINPENILRIEYHDSPDLRYDNRQVINIILKPREDGGTVVAGILGGAYTGFINGNAGANYHYGKSEFEINYRVNWRDYDKCEISTDETFIGRQAPITRRREGIPSDFNYLSNELSAGYTYMHDANSIFAVNAGISFESQNFDENSLTTKAFGGEPVNYKRLLGRNIDFTSPNIDLLYKRQFDESQYIEVNAFGRYSSGDYGRNYRDVYESASADESMTAMTHNKSWRGGGEFMYSKSFSGFTTNFGVKDYYNATTNSQTENGSFSEDIINLNRLSAYAQIIGRINRLNYGVNVSGIYNHSDNNGYKVDAARFKATVNMNYPLSRYVTLNYLFMYDPSMPAISEQSELIQTIDEISVRRGNPDLKPSDYIRNRIYIRYANCKFNGSLWAAHSRTIKPIYYDYSYISNTASPYFDKFMSSAVNGRHDDLVNVELDLAYERLFGVLNIWGNIGWDHYIVKLTGLNFIKNRIYASANAALTIGNWQISANYQIKPRYTLSGNTFISEDRWNTIKVQYNYRNWTFSLSGINLFTKRGSTYDSTTFSDVHPETFVQNIRDCANMLLVGINYRLDFGKKQPKTRRTLNNDGVERGVDINY